MQFPFCEPQKSIPWICFVNGFVSSSSNVILVSSISLIVWYLISINFEPYELWAASSLELVTTPE